MEIPCIVKDSRAPCFALIYQANNPIKQEISLAGRTCSWWPQIGSWWSLPWFQHSYLPTAQHVVSLFGKQYLPLFPLREHASPPSVHEIHVGLSHPSSRGWHIFQDTQHPLFPKLCDSFKDEHVTQVKPLRLISRTFVGTKGRKNFFSCCTWRRKEVILELHPGRGHMPETKAWAEKSRALRREKGWILVLHSNPLDPAAPDATRYTHVFQVFCCCCCC